MKNIACIPGTYNRQGKDNRRFRLMNTISLAALLVVVLSFGISCVAYAQNDRYRTMLLLPDKDIEVSRAGGGTPGEMRLYSSKDGAKVKRDNVVYMHFDLNYVPTGAIIDEVDLSLYLKSNIQDEEQFVRIYELQNQGQWNDFNWGNQPLLNGETSSRAVSGREISPDDVDKGTHFSFDNIDPATWLRAHNGNLWLFIAANQLQYTYYSGSTGSKSKQPKLIIKYHMPYQLQAGNWAQYKYDAQHTGQLAWESNAVTTAYSFKPVFNGTSTSDYIKSDPVYYNNKLIFYYQSHTAPMHRIRSYNENGVLSAENTGLDNTVTYGPVADRGNNIYCITGGNKIMMMDANDLRTKASKVLPDDAYAMSIPVIGFDGSIYLSTNKGVYAYTPMPELKVKWKYPHTEDVFGTTTLSEDEKTVFVFNGRQGKLLALNNINGHERWSKPYLLRYARDIPVASVKDTFLLLTDNLRNGKDFYILSTNTGQVIRQDKANADVISQPVVGDGKVYIINDGRVQSYRFSDGSVSYYSFTPALNPASSLVTDKDDNVYVLNLEQGKKGLAVLHTKYFKDNPTQDYSFAGNIELKDFLMVLPNGKLFVRNDNALWSLSPASFSSKGTIDIPSAGRYKSEYTYRSEGKITVLESTIENTQNVAIQAKSNGVRIRPKFKVVKGAQFTIYSQP